MKSSDFLSLNVVVNRLRPVASHSLTMFGDEAKTRLWIGRCVSSQSARARAV
jgi:hypothetical protein